MKFFRKKSPTCFNFPNSQFHFTTHASPQSIQSISENPFYNLLNLCRTLSSAHKIHGLLIVNGESNDALLKNKLVSLYGLFGQVKNARSVFDEMPDPNFTSCKAMMNCYFMNDFHAAVIGLYKFMRTRLLAPDNVIFSFVLKAFTELRHFGEGQMLHGYIIKVVSPNSFVLTGLTTMYAKCGEINVARKVFETIRDRNVVCWTSMIVGYVQNSCAEEGLLLFNRMRDCSVEGNVFTFVSVLTACAKLGALHQGKWVHGSSIKNGVEVTAHLLTSLIDMYAKCGAVHDARLVFDEFQIVYPASWTAMIAGYAQNGFAEEALKLFVDRKWEDVYPNSSTLASVVSSCAQLGNPIMGSSVYSLAIKLGQDDGILESALVDMFGKCHRIEDAVSLFESMEDKNSVSWNSLIAAYSQNLNAFEARRLFKAMRLNFLSPDSVTIVVLLSSCASTGDLWYGSSLHCYSIHEGFLAANSIYIGTALVSFYAKCGDVSSARDVFNEMGEKDAATWSAMIDGYAKQGNLKESLKTFEDMLVEHKVEPTEIIFTNILSACSRAGMVQEGWRLFEKMHREYKFVPSIIHYTCMVDMLARSGNLEIALEFIEKLPVQPNCEVFGAFLHGCSVHSRFDLGDLVVRKVLELQPNDAGHYMLMCNLHALQGKWREASRARDLFNYRGLQKGAGLSKVS